MTRVIRNCRLHDAVYADDIYEWIHEAVGRLEIKWRLPKKFKCITVTAHTAELPCELASIDAIIYNGCRLRYGSTDLSPEAFPLTEINPTTLPSYFQTDPTDPAYKNTQDFTLLRGVDLKQVDFTGYSAEFYQLEPGFIKTSFHDGEIYLFYKYRKMDKEGLPIIPNIEEAKEAIFWYVAGKLVFSGVQLPDPRIDYGYCDNQATKYLRLAKNHIKQMTNDQ
jgi:hypothetical protein